MKKPHGFRMPQCAHSHLVWSDIGGKEKVRQLRCMRGWRPHQVHRDSQGNVWR